MKTLLSISITAFTLSVVSIWNIQHASKRPSMPLHDVSSTMVNAPAVRKGKAIWVEEAAIFQGESFEIHFTTPHAPYLGVIDPRGHFFYLVYPEDPTLENLKPLVESGQFVTLKTLIIDTGTLEADPYIYGIYYNQPVFTTNGDYIFILGENLHVDDPNLLDKVVVHYTQEYRTALVYCNL